MRLNLVILLLLVAVMVLGNYEAYGQFVWTKDINNPVFSGGGPGAWDNGVGVPWVIFNSDSVRFEMWYSGDPASGGNVGFAVSSDGMSWKRELHPVLSPSPATWDSLLAAVPYVLRENGHYKMWYTGQRSQSGGSSIGYATSPDGKTWSKYAGNPVFTAGPAPWEAGSVSYCSVIKSEGGYVMFYTGRIANGDINRIGRATSVDGITWQRDTQHNPVLDIGTTGAWDRNVYLPRVMDSGGMYYLWYSAETVPSSGLSRIGLATSADSGKTWLKYAQNPVLTNGSHGSWDETYVELGSVLLLGNTFHIWYDGGAPPAYAGKIGHATSPLTGVRRLVPQEYATIQGAIDASSDGDTVLVLEGTYMENIRYRGKAIVVGSLYLIDGDASHVAKTIINGSGSTQADSGSVVYFVNNEDTTSVLCGLTITGGFGTRHLVQHGDIWVHWYRVGGGVFCDSAGARLTRNIITRNRVVAPNAFGGGVGAITISPSLVPVVVLEANLITDNYVQADSAVDASLGGGAYLGGVEPRVLGNVFERDTVIGRGTAAGGGVRFYGFGWRGSPYAFPNGTFVRNVFRSNVARATQVGVIGAGLALDITGDVTIQDNLFESNAATCVGTSPGNWAHGGGLYIWDDNLAGAGRKMILNNQFLNNTVVCPQWAIGGGMELQRSLGTVSGNNFRSNTATGTGNEGDAAGGGLSINEVPVEGTVVEKNKFIDNYVQHATEASGGAIRLCYARATVRANEMVGNTATGGTAYGGGIQIYQSAARVENNIIRGNSSKNYGGGIAVDSPPAYGTGQGLINNTVYGNSSYLGGGLSVTRGANVVSFNNIFWGDSALNSKEIYGSGVTARYCDVQGGYAGTGNINADPLFSDAMFNLLPSSPCIGRGIDSLQVAGIWYYAPTCDCDGHLRPNPGHEQGPDMGAQEEQGTTDVRESAVFPTSYALEQNYPNPFNPSTTIKYALPSRSHVTLTVFNTLGQKVATLVDEAKDAGYHSVEFDASGLASGVYVYRLQAGDFVQSRKLILVK